MQGWKWQFAACGLLTLLAPATAGAQGIGVIPDGVFLDATPAVSADRRYVRLTVNPMFSTVNGFQTFPVPAAVGGGGGGVGFGGGGLGFGGGGLGGGGLANGGGGGLFGPGAAGGPNGPVDYGAAASPFSSSFSQFINTPPATPVPARAKATRGKAAPRPAKRALRGAGR